MRGDRRLERFMLTVAILMAVFTVGSPLLGLRSLHSADILRLYDPWKADAPETPPQNSLLSDTLDVITPMHEEAKRRIADGDFPLNTNLPSGGMPLGSVPEWTVTGPLDLPEMFLPSWYAPGLVKFLELLAGLLFTALFLRRLGLGKAAATFGGMVYMNCGFMLVWTNWPQAGVTTLIPAVFWGVERAIQKRTARGAVPLALAVAAQILQGYPAITGFTLFFAAIYTAVRVLAQRGISLPRRVVVGSVVGLGVVFGFLLAAFQLLPFSHQLHDFYTEYRHQNPRSVLPPYSFATTFVPDGLGSIRDHVFYGVRNYAETNAFVGVSAIVVLIAGAARMRRSMLPPGALVFLWLATLGAIELTYVGRTPLRILQSALPSLFGMNYVGRMRSVLGFLLACLCAVALQAVVDRRGSGRWTFDVLVYAAGAGLLIQGYRALWHQAGFTGQHHFLVRHTVLPFVVGAVALVAVAGATWLKDRPRTVALMLLPVALAIESLSFARAYLPRIDVKDFYPMTATHRYVLDHLGHERMAGTNATMYPGTTTYYGIRSVNAHGFHAKTWHDLLMAAGTRRKDVAPTLPLFRGDHIPAYSAILDRLAARYWVESPAAIPPGSATPLPAATGTTALAAPVDVPARDVPRLRAVRVVLDKTGVTPDDRTYFVVEVLAADGIVVGRGTRRLTSTLGGLLTVPVSEPTRPFARVRLSLQGARRPVTLAAAGGRPVTAYVEGNDDGLRLVYSDGAAVYERLHALPRFRWARHTVVEPDPAKRIALLSRGFPADTVVLDENDPAPSGAAGTVTVERDTGDAMRVRVTAQGSGYLVVADAMQHGWQARLDGKRVRIVAADHAGVAVNVPAGTHTVTFDYVPAGWRTGVRLSILAALVLLALSVARRHHQPGERPLDAG